MSPAGLIFETRKRNLLIQIAELGYNVGFGAKKNFASLDMLSSIPSIVTIISIAFGILALASDQFAAREIAAYVTISGVIGMYVDTFRSRADEFSESGISLISIFNNLSKLYYEAKSANTDEELSELGARLDHLRQTYQTHSSPNQMLLSDWYAHYKFFWQAQVEWVDEQKNFKLLRDKIPLSFTVTLIVLFFLSLYFQWSPIAKRLDEIARMFL